MVADYRKIEFSKIDRPADVAPGSAPQLAWLDIASLVVDDSYQRDLKPQGWRAIRAIAAHFRWSMFSPVFVAPIEGGLYAIIDGQHRTHAAAICGFSQVPCQIVQMTRTEQAAAFAAVNGTVTQVSAGQIYKAALAAGEEWAVRIRTVAENGGCRLMTSGGSSLTKKPGQIFAVVAFRRLAERFEEGLAPALKVLMASAGWKDDAGYWDNNILFPVLGALCQRPAALGNSGFVDAFAEWPLWDEIEKAGNRRRERIKAGKPAIPQRELLESSLIDWIDARFPERVTLPAPERLSRAEAMARIGAMKGV